MFTSSLINEQGLGFDPYFNFIGGEDFEFFSDPQKTVTGMSGFRKQRCLNGSSTIVILSAMFSTDTLPAE